MIRLLGITVALGYYRWAAREINPAHEDAPKIALRITTLEHQQRAEITRLRRWRNTSPTLSAVKDWL